MLFTFALTTPLGSWRPESWYAVARSLPPGTWNVVAVLRQLMVTFGMGSKELKAPLFPPEMGGGVCFCGGGIIGGIDFIGTATEDTEFIVYLYTMVSFNVDNLPLSKYIQTYILDSSTGNQYNKFTFKTYNYLIFASTLGRIFNDIHLSLKETLGNLYKTDVTNRALYQNFGSYFNFKKPSWMTIDNYRRCVVGLKG